MKLGETDVLNRMKVMLEQMGAKNVLILDGDQHAKPAPIPDITAELDGKKLAVEEGYLASKDRLRILLNTGYEIVIWLPRYEVLFSALQLLELEIAQAHRTWTSHPSRRPDAP